MMPRVTYTIEWLSDKGWVPLHGTYTSAIEVRDELARQRKRSKIKRRIVAHNGDSSMPIPATMRGFYARKT